MKCDSTWTTEGLGAVLRCTDHRGDGQHRTRFDGHDYVWVDALPEKHDYPAHYGGKDNVYETIKVIAAWFPEGVVMFCLGNTIKYVSRHGKKAGETALEDLKKAKFYLDWTIDYLEKKNG